MNIGAVVFSFEDGLGHDDLLVSMSTKSIVSAGVEPIQVSEKIVKAMLDTGKKYLHFVERGTMILPDFYEAMALACEQDGTDYAYCQCSRIGRDVLGCPVPGDVVSGQLLIRSWVIEEVGLKGFTRKVVDRILTEYRGSEVPHILAMETNT